MKLFLFLFLAVGLLTDMQAQEKRVVANPMNLNYRFQFDEPSRREAADPVCEYFQGKYYLFASKSGGYWSSPDLAEWTYIPCSTIRNIEGYAPTILILGDTLYYLASGSSEIFYTSRLDIDAWQKLSPSNFTYSETDPAFFKDEDTGKVYFFWGCSDKDPIKGVEIDPNNRFKPIGTPKTLIEHRGDRYGWEVPGKSNEEKRTGWNEGPSMNKYNGKYYLQYAAPGTEYRIYGDGVYVGDTPLGPFTYMENNPFSIKPGGFIGGAGHGHTFKDKYGNFWHVATMRISVRHPFERRIGLFPVYFGEDNSLYAHTLWTDYPFSIPDKKTDFETDNCSMNWNLLSYQKPVSASSSHSIYTPGKANDETVETWWSAQTGNAGEWWQVDLGKTMQVNAIQVNFADVDFTVKAPGSYVFYQYDIKISDDGENWAQLIDRTSNTLDMPHELIVLDTPHRTRYLRITNAKNLEGKFSLSGFRVFGSGEGDRPKEVSGFQAKRQNGDTRRFLLSWDKQENTTGYIIHWGVKENELNHAVMVYTNETELGFFNRDSPYYFTIDAFNENGITPGTTVVEGREFFGTPYGGVPREIPGTIEAEDFNEGGQGFAYYDTTPGNSSLEYRPKEDVDIAYSNRAKAYYLTDTGTGEYTNYTIRVSTPGLYDFDCIGASTQEGKEDGFYLSFNGEKLTNPAVQILPAGSSSRFHTATLKNVFFPEGIQTMTFNIQGSIYADKFIVRNGTTKLNNPAQSPITVYPNPSAGIFHVCLPQSGLLSVTDVWGRNIYSRYAQDSSVTIDASDYSRGVYFLSFLSDNQTNKTKLIKK